MSSRRNGSASPLANKKQRGSSSTKVLTSPPTPLIGGNRGSRSPFLPAAVGRTVFRCTATSVSWICYTCASLWLGVAMVLACATAVLVLSVRHEALEDWAPAQCGPSVETQTLSTVGFGSCSKHDLPQNFWPIVEDILEQETTLAERQLNNNEKKSKEVTDKNYSLATCNRERIPPYRSSGGAPADAFIWLGDVVYLDGSPVRHVNVTVATEIAYAAMDVPIKGFSAGLGGNYSNLYYRGFKEKMGITAEGKSSLVSAASTVGVNTPFAGEPFRGISSPRSRIIGTWDDHDMGINDGGKEFKYHSHTRKRFLDFLSVEETDKLRDRNGIFSFHTVGAPTQPIQFSSGNNGGASSYALSEDYENAFCIILLDVRTHRDPIRYSRKGDMLGKEQWEWFEAILKNNVSDMESAGKTQRKKCAATIIGSGIQFLSSEKPTEQWWNFEENRLRLWKLLGKYQIARAALISGDIHLMELLKAKASFTGLGYPMIDFTSSGLTHQSGKFFDTFTRFRSLLAQVFPMAVVCTPRGETPVANAADGSSRTCKSAFSWLPDWVYEIIFPPMDWRIAHYLGRNVGTISLQASASADQTKSKPELSLRFAGYALSLEERNDIYVPWRYENEGSSGAIPTSQSEGVDSINAHAVTRHDSALKVIEYVQPLKELEIPSGFKSDETAMIDGNNHPLLKSAMVTFHGIAQILVGSRHARFIGIVLGFASLMIPIGLLTLWIAAKVVELCRGNAKRERRRDPKNKPHIRKSK